MSMEWTSTGTATALIVPTLNAGSLWEGWLEAFFAQSVRPDRVLIVDSSSEDRTADISKSRGFDVYRIRRSEFDHGGTRQLAVRLVAGAEIIAFCTQDAIFADSYALERLFSAFDDPAVGAAYGRQLPRQGAAAIEAHARVFNYPKESAVTSIQDVGRLGIKTAFISNSFAAYRRAALESVGGFPSAVIFGEDMYVAAKMLLDGWSIAYRADAHVFHSHAYRVLEEFRRYFDVGVLHAREGWLRQHFGEIGGEGRRFVKSEMNYLLRRAPWLIPSAVVRTAGKLLGYQLGRAEEALPRCVKRRLSMHAGYWGRKPYRMDSAAPRA